MHRRIHLVVAVVLGMAIAWGSSASALADTDAQRMAVDDGVNAIYRAACQMHCHKRRVDDCVRECLEQYFESVGSDEDNSELMACRDAGGMLRERINGCAEAMAHIIDMTDTTKLSEMFASMAEVELRCTSEALCDAPSEDVARSNVRD